MRTLLYNLKVQNSDRMFKDGFILIIDDKIESVIVEDKIEDVVITDDVVYHPNIPDIADFQADKHIDMRGAYMFPGFVDSHLHIPGKKLFELYGIDLSSCNSVDEYMTILLDKKQELLDRHEPAIRGYGWCNYCLKEDYAKFRQFIDDNFKDIDIVLFSSDFHSCICNDCVLKSFKGSNENGLVTGRDLFRLLLEVGSVTFSDEQMKAAILKYQDMLLDYGITTVQTLMFLGGNGFKEYRVLRELDIAGKLKIRVNIALTIYEYATKDELLDSIRLLKYYETDRIKFRTIKLYLDGVVENYTAYLTSNYEGKDFCGEPYWEYSKLLEMCRFIDNIGYQIHIHAIGDGAVHMACQCLSDVIGIGKNINRHVITHIQLMQDEDLELIKKHDILVSLQPYWFSLDDEGKSYEYQFIGDRAYKEYPVSNMLKSGVRVSFSSDSPVTLKPNPLVAAQTAGRRYNYGERVGIADSLIGFTEMGAYQLFRNNEIGCLRAGYKADIIGVAPFGPLESLWDSSVCFVMSNGEVLRLS